LTKQGIIARDIINLKGKFPEKFDTYQSVKQRDIVFCLFDIDETPRTVGLSTLEGMITGAYTVFEVGDINEKYLYYYYLSLDNHKQLKPLYTGLRKVINTDVFLRTNMPYPPREEQDQIVRYLESKLIKINKFIKDKKKLISLLKEQKQSIINQVVTKGLDSNAKMKQSGIEWVGDIPEEWDVIRNKNVLELKKNIVGNSSSEYDLLSLTTNGIILRDLESGKGKFPSDFSSYQQVCVDDIVFCLFDVDETPRTVGLSTLDGMITGAYTVFRIKNINKLFLYYYYLALDNKKALKPLYTGLRKVINTDLFLRTNMVLPPSMEQEKIVNYIETKTQAIDKAIERIKKELEFIIEYRTSLISSVVTGKIDVQSIEIEDIIEELEDDFIDLDEGNIKEEEFKTGEEE
jgi:type I restriction enzyme S subunit